MKENSFEIEEALKAKVMKICCLDDTLDFDTIFFFSLLLKINAVRKEKIPFIKTWRTLSGAGLKDSKEIVEFLKEKSFFWYDGGGPDNIVEKEGWIDFLRECEQHIPHYYNKLLSTVAIGMLTAEPNTNFAWKYDFADTILKNLKVGVYKQDE